MWGTAIKWLCKSKQGFCFKVFSSMNMMWLQKTREPLWEPRSRNGLSPQNTHLGITEPVTGCHHWAAEMWLEVHYLSAFKSTSFWGKHRSLEALGWVSSSLWTGACLCRELALVSCLCVNEARCAHPQRGHRDQGPLWREGTIWWWSGERPENTMTQAPANIWLPFAAACVRRGGCCGKVDALLMK